MKTTKVGTYQVKTHLSELLEKVRQGQVFLITRRGETIAELRPAAADRRRPQRGAYRGKIWISPDFEKPLEDFKDYM